MIHINFVEIHFELLHVKFQNHRPSGSEKADFLFLFSFFSIYSPGGYLCNAPGPFI